MKFMAIIYFQNPWQSSYKSLWKVTIIYLRTMVSAYFIPYYKLMEFVWCTTIGPLTLGPGPRKFGYHQAQDQS